MRSREILLIVCAVQALAEPDVIFPFSKVTRISTGGPSSSNFNFECAEACAVFAANEFKIIGIKKEMHGNIFGMHETTEPSVGHNYTEWGGIILEAGNYSRINTPRTFNEDYDVMYIVKKKAPNFGSPVFSLTRSAGELMVDTHQRYFTILSRQYEIEFTNFTGSFPPGYPKVYAAGFDALDEIYGEARCIPVYQARSQYSAENSSPRVSAPIATVDFGFVGEHSVTVKQPSGYNENTMAASIVYMTPGFVGCPFVGSQKYIYGERTISASFTRIATSLDVSIFYLGIPYKPAKFRINHDILDFISDGPSFFSKHYDHGAYKVELNWRGVSDGWFLQLDFGSDQQISAPHTEQRVSITTASYSTSTSPIPTMPFASASRTTMNFVEFPTTVRWQSPQNDNVHAETTVRPPPTPVVEASPVPSEASATAGNESEGLLGMTVHIRVLYICIFIVIVGILGAYLYKRRRERAAFHEYNAFQLADNL